MISRIAYNNFVTKSRCFGTFFSPSLGRSNGNNVSASIGCLHKLQCQRQIQQPFGNVYRSFSINLNDSSKPNNEEEDISKEKEEKEKKRERQKKYTNYTLVGMTAAFAGALIYFFFEWGKPKIDDDGNIVEDEFSSEPFFTQHVKRAWNTLTTYEKALKEPSRELLLPPPLTAPYYQPPYTLVLEMTGILVNPEWTYSSGWRFKKRPFVEYLLHTCATSQNFEIVIYTKENGFTAFPLLNNLDPEGYIMYRLFKDSTRYENGSYVKDLNMLNRDLKTVIHIDWDDKACSSNPDNCLRLKKWDGKSENDRVLYDLANFLMTISTGKCGDVREVLRYYSQFDDPLEVFKENQRKLAEYEKEAELNRQKQLNAKKSSFFSNRFK